MFLKIDYINKKNPIKIVKFEKMQQIKELKNETTLSGIA